MQPAIATQSGLRFWLIFVSVTLRIFFLYSSPFPFWNDLFSVPAHVLYLHTVQQDFSKHCTLATRVYGDSINNITHALVESPSEFKHSQWKTIIAYRKNTPQGVSIRKSLAALEYFSSLLLFYRSTVCHSGFSFESGGDILAGKWLLTAPLKLLTGF